VVSLSYEESLTLDSNRYQVYTFHDTTWGICFNTQSDSLKSESVRKALLGALDRTSLLSYLPEGATATSRILPPTTTFNGEDYLSLSGGVTLTSQDTTALTQKEKSAVPTVTVLCLNDDASKRMANEMITAWNKRFDHYYNMEPLSEAELTSRIRSGDYEVAITALHAEGSEPLSLLSQFTSGSKNNPAALQSKEYDKLLAVTESSTSQTVLESCHSAEQYLIDHGVFYPLYEKPRCYATLSSLQGIVLHPYEQGIDFLSVTKG
jgi:oligopeptide transport system substrate-binding protein